MTIENGQLSIVAYDRKHDKYGELSIVNFQLSIKKGTAVAVPFYQVVLMNFSLHLGQVMEIFPLPLGTLTCWRQRGQL